MRKQDTRKVWLVDFPTYQYNEDVKELARRADLKIYDRKVAVDFDPSRVEQNPPKLTKPGDKKKPGPKKKVDEVETPEQSGE